MSKRAEKKCRQRNKCIKSASLADPDANADTTAMLSDLILTEPAGHILPHMATAIMIGTISFAAM